MFVEHALGNNHSNEHSRFLLCVCLNKRPQTFPNLCLISIPICPLCLFWIKSIAHNNRHFWGTTPLNITSYTAHYTINTLSINLSRISFLLLSLLLSLHYSLNNAWLIMVWHILRWSFFSGIQSKYCENIITKYSLQS